MNLFRCLLFFVLVWNLSLGMRFGHLNDHTLPNGFLRMPTGDRSSLLSLRKPWAKGSRCHKSRLAITSPVGTRTSLILCLCYAIIESQAFDPKKTFQQSGR